MKVTHYAGHRVEIGQMTAYLIEIGLNDVIVYTKTSVIHGRLWPYMFIPNAKPVTWRDDKIGIEVAPEVWAPEEYKDQVKAHLERVQTKRTEKFIEIDQNLNALFYDSMGGQITIGAQVLLVARLSKNDPLSFVTEFNVHDNGRLSIYKFAFKEILVFNGKQTLRYKKDTGLKYALNRDKLPEELFFKDYSFAAYQMESSYFVGNIQFTI